MIGPPPAWSEDRTAIVTGGGSGIGLAISKRLAAEGAAVAVWDRNGDAAKAAAAEIEAAGGKAIGLTVDVADRARIDEAVVPHMIAAGWGRIVNISSSSAQTGSPRQAHYVASKAGVIGLTMSLATELGPKGITVNTIPPRVVDTPSLRQAEQEGHLGKEGVALQEKVLPVRRAGRPEDIAAACAYLVRDEAGYVTGQVLGVNGGRVVG